MATDKLVARVDWRPLADDQLGLHELVVWGCPTIGPEAPAPLCRLLTDRNGWAGPVANFQLFAALVVMWKSVEQLNQATPGAFFSIPFPSITAIVECRGPLCPPWCSRGPRRPKATCSTLRSASWTSSRRPGSWE